MTQKEAKALVTDSSRWKLYLTDKDFRVFVFQHKNLVCYRFESRLTYTDWTGRRQPDGKFPEKTEWNVERYYYREKKDPRLYGSSITDIYNRIWRMEKKEK